jgi:hypothetical protein
MVRFKPCLRLLKLMQFEAVSDAAEAQFDALGPILDALRILLFRNHRAADSMPLRCRFG